jgi:hypothetical protein
VIVSRAAVRVPRKTFGYCAGKEVSLKDALCAIIFNTSGRPRALLMEKKLVFAGIVATGGVAGRCPIEARKNDPQQLNELKRQRR